MSAFDRYARVVAEKRGWQPGSTLENRFIAIFNNLGVSPRELVQEHRVGKFRIDFAAPDVLIGIEADGFYHRMPRAAERDAERDAWLLTQEWFVIRISDDCYESELRERIADAVRMVREERRHKGLPDWFDPRSRRKPSMSVHAARILYEIDRQERAERRRRRAA